MPTHLGQVVSNHVTLELVGGIKGGYGPEQLGWLRILPDGNIESGPGSGNYVVPARKRLVITDLDWQYNDHGTANVGAAVTLRLFGGGGKPQGRRLMESTMRSCLVLPAAERRGEPGTGDGCPSGAPLSAALYAT